MTGGTLLDFFLVDKDRNMSDLAYSVRVMRKEDVPHIQEMWKKTKFQEGTQTYYTWQEVDREAFYVAVTESGEVIGACSAIIHHEDLAFVGIYIVEEKYRGKGIGYKVWSACMDHIGPMNVSLNTVEDKIELYRDKAGFPLVETEWNCVVNEATLDDIFNPEALSDVIPEGVEIQPFQDSLLPSMLEYDYSLMGYKRDIAVEFNCKEKDSQTFVAMKDGACIGWGTIKLTCLNFGMVGPLYADDAGVAEVILRQLIVNYPRNKGFSMTTISTNMAANMMMKKIGCRVLYKFPRLYRKYKLNVDINKVFAHFNCSFSPF